MYIMNSPLYGRNQVWDFRIEREETKQRGEKKCTHNKGGGGGDDTF